MKKVEQKSNHYAAIDGLRAFSAIGIVLMHVLANGNYAMDGFIFTDLIPSFTNLVFLFMIISGYAMCCGYYDKIINNKITVGEFYSKRYKKIWPFFALLCLLDLVISPSVSSAYEVVANLTLCFGLLGTEMTVIGVGWFLGVVFVFYLLFPFFCYLLSDKRRAWFSLTIALVFNYLCQVYFNVGRNNFVYSAVFFIGGGIIFLYREKLEALAGKWRWIVLLLCVVATVGYYIFGDTVLLMLVLFSLYLVYAIGSSRRGILQNVITRFLSGISMEIYLSHMVIFRLLEKMGVTHLFGDSILSYVVSAMGTAIGTVVFAVVIKWGLKRVGIFIKRIQEINCYG